MHFRNLAIAAKIVVPVPKNGSKTVSPLTEYIFISLYANSKGYAAFLFLVFEFLIICEVPLTSSHTSLNQLFLSSQK